jgi:hypothetical protein
MNTLPMIVGLRLIMHSQKQPEWNEQEEYGSIWLSKGHTAFSEPRRLARLATGCGQIGEVSRWREVLE